MAASPSNMEEEFLTCNICYDVFKEPKTLSCLHRFCEKCLHNYIIGQKSTQLVKQGGFQCPTCRELIKTPNPKRPPSDWASLLKTDFHLKNLIRFVESQNEMTSQRGAPRPDHPCQVHKDKETDLYCVDCSSVICHLCAGISHRGCAQVMSLEEAAADRRAMVQIWISNARTKLKETASLQKSREKCMNQIERQRIEAEASIKSRGQELRKLVARVEEETLKSLERQYKYVQDKLIVHVYKFEDKLTHVRDTMELIPGSLKSVSDYELLSGGGLEKIKKNINIDDSDVQSYHTSLKYLAHVKLTFQRSETPNFSMGTVVSNNEDFDTSSSAPNPVGEEKTSLLDRLRGVRNRKPSSADLVPVTAVRDNNSNTASAFPTRVRKPELPPRIPRKMTIGGQSQRAICFPQRETAAPIPPPVPQNARQHTEIVEEVQGEDGGFGSVPFQSRRRRTLSHSQDGSTASPGVENSATVNEISDVRVTQMRTINCRFREDEHPPKLRDVIVVSPSNSVIVTDWANQSVKAVCVRRDRDNRLAVGGKPWAITQLGENMCAVSLPISQQICILKMAPTLMLQNAVMSTKKYCGLAALNSTTLVASGGNDPPSVDIINLYGEVLKTFANDRQGAPLFQYPAYVSVTPSMDILVSDRKQGAVFAMSHRGEVKFKFHPDPPRRLQEPSGVTSDRSGRLLVAETRGLLSLTATGQLSHPVVRPQDQILSDPRGLAMDTEGHLYITTHDDCVLVLANK